MGVNHTTIIGDPVEYVQVAEYKQTRQALLIANQGPDAIYVSTKVAEVNTTTPQGIVIPAMTTWRFTWVIDGEITWGPWYASCTSSIMLVWEWIGTQVLGDPCYSPSKSPIDLSCVDDCECKKIEPIVLVVPEPPKIRLSLTAMYRRIRERTYDGM